MKNEKWKIFGLLFEWFKARSRGQAGMPVLLVADPNLKCHAFSASSFK